MTQEPSDTRPTVPRELVAILNAASEAALEEAWTSFVAGFTDTMLRVVRSLGGEHDLHMDRYTFVLERLRENGCCRLRAYARPGAGEFQPWLIVVARRLCLDHYRQLYGRARDATGCTVAQGDRAGRRRLVDLLAEKVDASLIPASARDAPDEVLARAERTRALESALAVLPPRDRLLLALRFTEELSAREITRLMKFPTLFHVYRRLNSVLGILRGTLKAQGLGDSAL